MNLFYEIIDPINKISGGFLAEFSILTALIRMCIVVLAATILGVERSKKRHAAGLRTFILTSLFAVMAMLLDMFFINKYEMTFPVISCAVVVGIAIISSNTLLYSSKNQIKGLTTAVALWSSTFIGLTIGAGLYTVGLIGIIITYVALQFLPILESYLKNRSNFFEIHLELTGKNKLADFISTIRKLGIKIDDIETNPAYLNSGLSVYTISLTIVSDDLKKYKTHKEIIEALSSLDYINCIEEIN